MNSLLIILGIILVIIVFNFKRIKTKIQPKAKKPAPKKVGQQTTNPNPPAPTPKKGRDWGKALKSVLWTLILLSLFVLMIVGIVWLWPKVFREREPEAQNETQSDPSVVIITDDISIEYANLAGTTYRLASTKFEFECLEATEPYCLINNYGKKFYADKNEDVTTIMPYSKGNKEFKIKSQNGKVGRLRINVIK